MEIIQGEKIVIWFVIGAAVMACISLAFLRAWRKKITTRIDAIRKLALGPEIDKSSNLESALESLEVELSPEGFERPVLVELGWYGASIDALPLGIIFADKTGKIVHRNPAALSFFNEYEKIINETLTELIEVSLSGVQLIRELNLDQATDKKAKFLSQPIEIDDHLFGTVILMQDISEEERLNATRRDFVANISHELKTPIGAMVLLAETLQKEDEPNLVKDLSDRIAQEAQRLAGTIDDLSALSQIEHGSQKSFELIPISYPVKAAISRASVIAEQRSISIHLKLPENDLFLKGDNLQITSAIYNLIENAIKYSEEETGEIAITAIAKENEIELTVQDNGIGIPETSHDRVFERFYRVDQSRSRSSGGTGLGLAIVRHVIINHEGTISLDSEEGSGSIFTVCLPREEPNEGNSDLQANKTPITGSKLQR
ncbi:MAG: ATP-binding protein [Acidimicrobiales bacterium]|nr:ATP-binding protein [Acidimicrobiales bacterium]